MELVYVALGSNLGDRAANLAAGLAGLAALPRSRLIAASSVYETPPVGGPAQGPYLNAAAGLETALPPRELLTLTQKLEKENGRVRGAGVVHWGPRTLDIDILFYGELTLDSEELTLPHPRLHERAFVLAPLAEIAGGFRHPVLGKTVTELLLGIGSRHEGIRRLPL